MRRVRLLGLAVATCLVLATVAVAQDRAAGTRPLAPEPPAAHGAPASVADGETKLSGAGAGLFPDGAELNGVRLSGSTFGTGVLIFSTGSAFGTYQTFLVGTTLLGLPQRISVEGKVSAGARNPDGSVTFSGSSIVDMGDGTVPSAGVPFSVTATPSTLALVLGTTALPTQSLVGGSITIR